jgi:YidC/Oxa1 family membrane protein insertase
MSAAWAGFVSILQAAIFGLSHVSGGSVGGAVICAAVVVRLALLPLTVRIALAGRAHARRVRALQPELARLRERWSKDPARMLAESSRVYERHGLKPFEPSVLRGTLLQAPLFLGFYQAIRGVLHSAGSVGFLWITSLARPSYALAVAAAVLAGAGAAASGSPTGVGPATAPMILLSMSITLLIVLNVSSGMGLYIAGTSSVSVLQALIVRRREAQAAR